MLLTDRAYDADWIRARWQGALADNSAAAQSRGPVATRYDKLAANYLAYVQLASRWLWPRVNEYAR